VSAAAGAAQHRRAEIKHVLPFLRRWLWLIVLIAVIPPVVIGGRLRPTYTAITRIQMTAPPDVGVTLYQQGVPYSNLRDDLTVARTDFIQASYSPQVRNRAVTAVGVANADLAYLPLVQPVRDSNFVDVIVEARTGQLAATMANAHAEAAIAYVSELRALPAKAAVTFLTSSSKQAQAELEAAQSAAATAPKPNASRAECPQRAGLLQADPDQARRGSPQIDQWLLGSVDAGCGARGRVQLAERPQSADAACALWTWRPRRRRADRDAAHVVARKPMSRPMLKPALGRMFKSARERMLKPALGRRIKPVLRRIMPSRARALDTMVLLIGVSLGMLAGAMLVRMALRHGSGCLAGGHS